MGKKKERKIKGKKKKKPKKSSEKWKMYVISEGKLQRKARFCPRCGPGIFLAESSDRFYCGKCHYTEFKTKKDLENPGKG